MLGEKREMLSSVGHPPTKRKAKPITVKAYIIGSGKKENIYLPEDSQQQQRSRDAFRKWKDNLRISESIFSLREDQTKAIHGALLREEGSSVHAYLQKLSTKKLETLGDKVDKDKKALGILCLKWEEILFLLDQDKLSLACITDYTTLIENVEGVIKYEANLFKSLTIPSIYSLCLQSVKSDPYQATHWACFNHLKRLGFILRRSKLPSCSEPEIVSEEEPEDNQMDEEETCEIPLISREWFPPLTPLILHPLKVHKSYSPDNFSTGTPHEGEDLVSFEAQYSIYKPRKSFSKRNSGPPDKILACVDTNKWSSRPLFQLLQENGANSSLSPLYLCCSDFSLRPSFVQISRNISKQMLTNPLTAQPKI